MAFLWSVGLAITVVSLIGMVIGAVITIGSVALGRRRSRATPMAMRLLLCGPGGATSGMAVAMLGTELEPLVRLPIFVLMAAFGIGLLLVGVRAHISVQNRPS